jgi:hypothetical protein
MLYSMGTIDAVHVCSFVGVTLILSNRYAIPINL